MANLTDADKVLRNDTGKNIVSALNTIAENLIYPDADKVSYDNTVSGLSATEVQSAVDELSLEKADKSNTYTKSEVDTLIDNLPEPMIFKGTLGAGGTIETLPVASAENEGWVFKCITEGTYSGLTLKVGDTVTCFNPPNTSIYEWDKTGSQDTDTDTWRAIKVNGTEKLGNAISSGSVDFIDTSDIKVTFDTNGKKIKLTLVKAIPTKTSDLQNDSGFTTIDDTQTANNKTWSSEKIANSIPDVSNYYNKDEIDAFLEDKADVDGTYDLMTVGNAKQLKSNVGENDKVPYNFRTSGGSIDIGESETDMLVGGTVAFNQLVQTTDTSVTVTSGHKYLSKINNVQTVAISNGTAISIDDGTKDNVHDLTQMFGSTIADYIYSLESGTPGAGVAYFRSLFPKPYYAYNAGELMSVKTSAHKMVGFNAWNEEWEVGKIDTTTGQDAYANNQIRCIGYIPANPSTTYYINSQSVAARVLYYDINKTLISSESKNNQTFTTPSNCYYIRFYLASAYGTTYNNDICINLSWDGERDGEYEPYEEHTYALDSNLELRGIAKLDANNKLYYDGDTYESDGTVTRKYGVVDLGTLANWSYDSTNQRFYSWDLTSTIKAPSSNSGTISMLCLPYLVYALGSLANMGIAVSTTKNIYIKNTNYDDTTINDFIASLSGVYLVYELATPTTEEAEPFTNPQIVNDFGTEEYVDTRAVAIPVGHDTFYQANLRAKLEMAPDSPSGNGDYIVRQTDGQNEYVALTKELPTLPTTDGTYTLKCTVSGGTPTLSWVADS